MEYVENMGDEEHPKRKRFSIVDYSKCLICQQVDHKKKVCFVNKSLYFNISFMIKISLIELIVLHVAHRGNS